MKKIVLSENEIRVIHDQLSGNFDRLLAPQEDKQFLMDVIDKAVALQRELNDFEHDDTIEWFWNKYKAQEGIAE